jgi:hypothetical protein
LWLAAAYPAPAASCPFRQVKDVSGISRLLVPGVVGGLLGIGWLAYRARKVTGPLPVAGEDSLVVSSFPIPVYLEGSETTELISEEEREANHLTSVP